MELAGVTAATSERAITTFLSHVGQLHRDMMLGEESTNRFALAIKGMGIEIVDAEGNLRNTEDLLRDVNRRFQEYGPGVLSAQRAQELFGYSGRYMLPILTDQRLALEDYIETAERFGSTLNALDRKEYEEFRKSNAELKQSLQGVGNYIAGEWIPVLTGLARITANLISIYRRLISRIWEFTLIGPILAKSLEVWGKAAEWVDKKLDSLGVTTKSAAQAEEELAQAWFNGIQAAERAADVEAELQRRREETLEQLGRLKADLDRRLTDIERTTAQRWDDIIVGRMRDAFDQALQLSWRMEDLRADLNEKLDRIDRDFAQRWDDILVTRQREAFERSLRLMWQLQDMQREYEYRRETIYRDFAEREAKLRDDYGKRREKAEENAREKLEDLERKHQERLFKIQQDYRDTVEEAARANDAVAVAQAMRKRARAMRDEERRFTEEQRSLQDDLTKKRQELERDRREREADHAAELQRTLDRAQENYTKQQEALARAQERERIIRQMHERWQEEDMAKARARQVAAAQAWYNEQIIAMEKAMERENILRGIQYRRQEEDFELAKQRQLEDAQRWYDQERDELATQLDMTGRQLEAAYADWIRGAQEAAKEVARAIAQTWVSEISRYQQYLPYPTTSPEIQRYGQYLPQQTTGTRPPILVAQQGAGGVWSIPGQPMIQMAEGGVIHASSPTHVMMGEAGPETGIFMPGRGGSAMSVNHNFGPLGVDFGGLPAGMNTQQVQAIVYEVVTQLAERVNIGRG